MELEVLTEWIIIPPLPEGGGGYTVLPLSVRPSKIFFSSHFSQQLLMAEIWYCNHLVRPSIRLSVVHTFVTVISASTGRNDFIFDIWLWHGDLYRPCLPFPGLPHIYFLFTVRLTNERVGVFIARRSVQHLVWSQALYRYPISWEAVFDPSDSYFLFAEERGYHNWALAHSSSCCLYIFFIYHFV